MKYVFIQQHQAEFSIKAMCRVLRVARSGWYAWRKRRTVVSAHQQFRRGCDNAVREAFTRAKQRYGAPRLVDELHEQGRTFNVKTVAASLRRQWLRAKAARKFSPVSYRDADAGLQHQRPEPEVVRRHHILAYRRGLVISRGDHRPVVAGHYRLVDVITDDSATGL